MKTLAIPVPEGLPQALKMSDEEFRQEARESGVPRRVCPIIQHTWILLNSSQNFELKVLHQDFPSIGSKRKGETSTRIAKNVA